jgi:O-antigen ligase
MEVVVLLLVCLSPWGFGAVDSPGEFALFLGVGLLLVLWAAVMLLQGRLTWRKCPVALCLAALFLLGVWQLTPLPRAVLGWVSPASARAYDQLLPGRPEELPQGEERARTAFPPGSTISLYPGATQRELVKVLAAFLLFAAVRNNTATPGAFRRLAAAATVNGALLSLLALAQYFGSPHNTIYWTYPTEVDVFGPFVCRNHFSFYVNLCVGLAAGLLLGFATPHRGPGPQRGGWSAPLIDLLHDPRALWVGGALVLMLSAVAVSLSRGGVLALLGAGAVCAALRLWQAPRLARPAAVVLVLGATLALLAWFGLGRVTDRWAAVWEGKAAQEDRLPMWTRLLPLTKDYPLWGCGYGVFDYVEPTTRTTGENAGWRFEHAHNDYLEALLEGGLVRLALTLLALALVFRFGWKALRRHVHDPGGGLALGGLFGLAAVAIHSFVDFGLHIPAVAVFAVVLCAHLCAAGDAPPVAHPPRPLRAEHEKGGGAASRDYSFGLFGVGAVVGAATAVGLGLLLAAEGWRAVRAQRLRADGAALLTQAEIGPRERGLGELEAAAALAPEYALLHAQLAHAHLDLYQARSDALARGASVAAAAQAVSALGGVGPPPGAPHPVLAAAPAWLAGATAREERVAARSRALAKEHVTPGLRHLLAARDLCPLLADPHLQIALHLHQLGGAEPRDAYLERVKRLAPDEPEPWYLCGVQELFDGQADRAWGSWRRSLELSNVRLPEILGGVAQSPDPRSLLDRVLPERADLWLAAADRLYPEPDAAEKRRPLLEKALALLEDSSAAPTGDDLHQRAVLCASLGRPADALVAYEQALGRKPDQVSWRLEFAGLLRDRGRLRDSRRELLTILEDQPGHEQARELLEQVTREIAAKE